MKTRSVGIVVLLLTFGSVHFVAWEKSAAQEPQNSTGSLPAAEDVIAEYMEAIGSEMALHGIQTISLEAKFDGLGSRGNGDVLLHYSNGSWRYDFQLEDGKFTYLMCRDGWLWQCANTWREMQPIERVKFQEIVPVANGPLRWLEYDGEIELKGIEDVLGKKCYHIKFRPVGGDPVSRFFDVDSKLMVRMSYMSEGMSADWYLSDYQEIEGFMIPMKREQHFNGTLSYQVLSRKVVINEDVDEEMFARPENSSDDNSAGQSDDG